MAESPAASEKRRLSVPGIYRLRNLVNGKEYIGLSRNIYLRFAGHRSRRRCQEHLSISRAIKKYGICNFAFEVLEFCAEEVLFEREQHWIQTLQPAYNRNGGGQGNPKSHGPSTRLLLSKRAKEQWERMSDEERTKRIKHNLWGPRVGREISEETRQKIRKTLTGRRMPLEVRNKIGAANRISMIGNKNGCKRRKKELV